MRLQSSVRWSVQARPAGIQMQDFQITNQSQIVSAKCGGNCGKCNPAGDVLVEQLHCGKLFRKTIALKSCCSVSSCKDEVAIRLFIKFFTSSRTPQEEY